MADEEKQELEQVEQSVRDTEDELMKSAFEPKAKEPEEKAPEVEATSEKPERERDPATGKFVKREGDVEQKPQAVEQPQADKERRSPAFVASTRDQRRAPSGPG